MMKRLRPTARCPKWVMVVAALTLVTVVLTSASVAQVERERLLGEAAKIVKELEALLVRLQVITARLPGVLVAGFVAGALSEQKEGPRPQPVYLPEVRVFIEDPIGGATPPPPQETDLSGRFVFRGIKPGKYRLCWKAPGFTPGCRPFDVAGDNVHLGDVVIFPERDDRVTLVYGDVRLADGSRPRLLSPLAGVNAYARVELLDSARRLIGARAVNNFGQYVLPTVPVRASLSLRAVVENGVGEQPVLPDANLAAARAHRIDLVIANSAPTLSPIGADNGAGGRLKVARPGATVKLTADARDPDGDVLSYRWLVAAGSGTVSSPSSPNVDWTLPGFPGLYSVTVMVYDSRGGYAQSSLSLRADTQGIPFSGFVDGTDGTAVAGAVVDINGQQTVTAADGSFSMRARDADRFVVNIRKTGFGLVSQVYDDAVQGGQWTLPRATVLTANPAAAIDVVDQRDSRNCPGPRSARLNFRDFPRLATPQWQDGKGNVVTPFGKLELMRGGVHGGEPTPGRGCGPGIRVRIPANSLVDQNGQAPAGAVTIGLTTVDLLSPDQMPGDYTVFDAGGGAKAMQSYGAGSIEITAGTRRYNLRPGAEAEVTIPADRSQLDAAGVLPATIPILFYDERRGVWVEEGQAKLSGAVYVTRVKHFSSINTDLVKTGQSCVRVDSPSLPANYNLEITIPRPGAAPTVLTKSITNTAPNVHVLYNLPSNTNIIVVPIRLNNNTPIGTFVVNTGGAQNPQQPNLPAFGTAPNYYPACATKVVLTDPAVAPPAGEFLHGLSFAAVNLTDLAATDPALAQQFDQATQAYYQRIDPRGKRPTLQDFKNVNGFPAGEIRAIYANSGDLGFGRDMHCTKQTASDGQQDVACYVTNYGNILTADSQDVIDAVNNANPVATVAMEFSRIESAAGNPTEFDDPVRTVKFYVYNANGSQLLRSADLDSGQNLRARPVPQLCMVCHGGQFPTAAGGNGVPVFNSRDDVKLGSRFLPFDLRFYAFAAAPNDKATQQGAFKQLNETIVKATQPGAAIDEVITQMYTPGPTQNEAFVIAGWNTNPVHQVMYRDVVGRACRTCHVANAFPALNFVTAQQAISDPSNTARLGNIEQRVCVQGVMPHAKRTHELFWTSVGPHMPSILQVFGDTFKTASNGWNGTLCGTFTAGGATPPSLYTSTVYPIWGAKGCNGCHIGSTPPAGLNLAGSNLPTSNPSSTFNQLLQNAQELVTMKRITPNNTAQSYLDHKIKGTQAGVGGSGSRMPFGCSGSSCLDNTQLSTVDNWINAGAPPP